MNDLLKKALLEAGADTVGFADVEDILGTEIAHLTKAISIGICKNLNENTVGVLDELKRIAVRILKKEGYKYLSIPADSDRIKNTFIAKLYPLFPHKIAATSAGIGWIGRNGLLIHPTYGPRLSLATVLTDAPLKADNPISKCRCGDCRLCIEYCPSAALTGNEWSRTRPYVELVRLKSCKNHKKGRRALEGKPNCGLCIAICPYGRKDSNVKDSRSQDVRGMGTGISYRER